jgi:hypothetical protein
MSMIPTLSGVRCWIYVVNRTIDRTPKFLKIKLTFRHKASQNHKPQAQHQEDTAAAAVASSWTLIRAARARCRLFCTCRRNVDYNHTKILICCCCCCRCASRIKQLLFQACHCEDNDWKRQTRKRNEQCFPIVLCRTRITSYLPLQVPYMDSTTSWYSCF